MNRALQLILNHIDEDNTVITYLRFTNELLTIKLRFYNGEGRRIFVSTENCYFANNQEFTQYIFNEFVSEYELIRRNLNCQ